MEHQRTAQPSPALPSRRLMRLAVIGAGLLAVAGAAAFYYASRHAGSGAAPGAIVVTITEKACVPNELTVPAGRTTFKIVNASQRALEWEIIQGMMVIEERENILPGFSQTLTAKLSAGEFEITCGLLNNPRGALHVTRSVEADREAARPALIAFLGPMAEYQVYLAGQASALIRGVQALDAAIQAGDLEQARSLYGKARRPYKRIEAVAKRFADLDNAIDPVADYLEKREADPAFTGFHRIEYGLFAQGSIDGLAPVSARLSADVTVLKERLRALKLSPDQMTAGAARLVTAMAETKIVAGEDHYAGTDLADFAANLEGVARTMALLRPVAVPAAPGVVAEIETHLRAADAALAALKGPGGFPPYGSVDAAGRRTLSEALRPLAGAIGRFNAAVGLE